MFSGKPDPAAPRIVHRDRDLIVFDKPTGLPTTSPDQSVCLASLARQLDPQAPRMHASSRLDAEVTGLVTFARTDRGIEALLEARRAGSYHRFYVGITAYALHAQTGELRFRIGRDPRDARRRVALPEDSSSGMSARSRYRVLTEVSGRALVLLRPFTGRTHQLRVHVAQAGAPLLGDKHYGGPARVVLADGRVVRAGRVMLHCARVELPAIDGAGQLVLEAPVPEDMQVLWQQLGGAVEAFSPEELGAAIAQERAHA